VRNFFGEVTAWLSRELLQLIALAADFREAVLPHFVIDRIAGRRPIVVRPFQIVVIVRIPAEVEEVVLRNANVLHQLPW